MKFGLQVILGIGLLVPGFSFTPQDEVRYLPFDQVKDLIGAMESAGAPDVPTDQVKDAASWDRWIQARDHEIRSRIDRGIEDSISNLILFGTSFTALPPLPSFAKGAGTDGHLTEASRARVHALALTVQRPGENERIKMARDFLVRRHVAADSVERYLAGNLHRMIAEEGEYLRTQQAAVKTGDPDAVALNRATIFKQRGLSFDTSLEPDFALESMLRRLVRQGLLSGGSVKRIAVMGPGLDFADKRIGLDFYPVQTIQPFAILESVLRLRLGDPGPVRVVAFDLNPSVRAHIERLSQQAAGTPLCSATSQGPA